MAGHKAPLPARVFYPEKIWIFSSQTFLFPRSNDRRCAQARVQKSSILILISTSQIWITFLTLEFDLERALDLRHRACWKRDHRAHATEFRSPRSWRALLWFASFYFLFYFRACRNKSRSDTRRYSRRVERADQRVERCARCHRLNKFIWWWMEAEKI